MKSKYNFLKKVSFLISILPLFSYSNLLCMEYQLATADYNESIKIWKSNKNKKWNCIQMLDENEGGFLGPAHSLYLESCGRYLFAASSREIKIWKKIHSKYQHIQTLKLSSNFLDYIVGLHLSRCGTYLISGSYENSIRIWEKKKDRWKKKQTLHNNGGENWISFCSTPCCNYFFSADKFHNINIWANKNGVLESIQTLNSMKADGHIFPILSLCISKNGKYLFSGSQNQTIKIWKKVRSDEPNKNDSLLLSKVSSSTKRWKCIQTLNGPGAQLMHLVKNLCLSLSPCGTYLCSKSNHEIIKIWKKNKNNIWEHIQTLDESTNEKNQKKQPLCISPCTKYLFSISRNINIWKKMEISQKKRHKNPNLITSFLAPFEKYTSHLRSRNKNKQSKLKYMLTSESLIKDEICALCLINEDKKDKEKRLKFLRKKQNIFQTINLLNLQDIPPTNSEPTKKKKQLKKKGYTSCEIM